MRTLGPTKEQQKSKPNQQLNPFLPNKQEDGSIRNVDGRSGSGEVQMKTANDAVVTDGNIAFQVAMLYHRSTSNRDT